MAVKQRYQEADYLNVGAGTDQYVLMGTGLQRLMIAHPHRLLQNGM